MSSAADLLHPDFRPLPYWWDDAPPETARDEALPARADVVIVGSGYCGMNAAAEFASAGRDVVLVDAGPLGIGASTRNTGGVTGGQKLLLAGPTRNVTAQQLALMLQDSLASFAYVTGLIEEEGLDAGFQRCGRFLTAYTDKHYARLLHLGELLREHTGVRVTDIPADRLGEIIATDFYRGGILIEDYASVHPARYHRALRQRARKRGARLFSHAEVGQVTPGTDGHSVVTVRGTIKARQVVLATNGYLTERFDAFRRRLIPVASYHIATEELPPERVAALLPRGHMVSDSQRNLTAVRPSTDGRRLIFGARPAAFDRDETRAAGLIHRAMCDVFPSLGDVRVSHCWRGTVAMTFDRKPHLGEEDGIFYALGCNASGVAMMSYLGREIARRAMGTQPRKSAFETEHFPQKAWYRGDPWFVPPLTAAYNLLDGLDRRSDRRP
ncbi:FAD-binding oxidoreductase [Ancylobacter sp. MQZ15Z-1]|uniref:FAD-binding oxidoreductase n=1 Tax=Ancylobacter mangrovi TaxID=2972472 RepID=A0A9X2PDT7_9HYPH|nr:FAD-binding oxidoreductase [Ancylobacter mangrovi]MCS0496917.1 FAD-binding oxidoreductase [Ancylobacter mangrovi]